MSKTASMSVSHAYVNRENLHCRNCGRAAGTAEPWGWYALSVTVPKEAAPKGYVYLGMLCSVKCLEAHLPVVWQQDDKTLDDYPRT